MKIEINLDLCSGQIKTIYDDNSKEILEKIGKLSIKRASHVEPNSNGDWVADMSPVNGPQLGPFKLRQDAINAEISYLKGIGYA